MNTIVFSSILHWSMKKPEKFFWWHFNVVSVSEQLYFFAIFEYKKVQLDDVLQVNINNMITFILLLSVLIIVSKNNAIHC